ncbi:MAG: UvrD-helicase domain-containing protein [Gammaproteobacteria bacterium AqS3]|nr:UvrD-helicase domain-containing protein [Gammaproteobacteria bacterium AqS3]
MTEHPLLDSLNPEQREAVSAPVGHVLVLAGAGSGKTRVLVHRVAWLIGELNVKPDSILQVTFTNRAAREMRERTAGLLQGRYPPSWLGTFHSVCYRLLRSHPNAAGLESGFRILDADAQKQLVRQLLRDGQHNFSDKLEPAAGVGRISAWKDFGRAPEDVDAHLESETEAEWARLYRIYNDTCRANSWIDFGDMLSLTRDMLAGNEALLERYREQFWHILVDEFQDVNSVQYELIRLLSGLESAGVMAVGDDDQSIYSWRGASADNMMRFHEEFPDVNLVRLERNYRSTQQILNVANRLASCNRSRIGKTLTAEHSGGEAVEYVVVRDERTEAAEVVTQIKRWCSGGGSLEDVAVLYRNNVLSRSIEFALQGAGIPYIVYGGARFFERASVRDVMAYVLLAENPHDDLALRRAAMRPRRGIGERSLEKLSEQARARGVSLWQALQEAELSGRGRQGAQELVEIIRHLGALRERRPAPSALVEEALQVSGLLELYEDDEGAQEHFVELIGCADGVAEGFTDAEQDEDAVTRFLAATALDTGDQGEGEVRERIKLMTLHSAKGLEFPLVLLTALEEGILPSERSLNASEDALEEERRLLYVGITRAMRQLVLLRCQARMLYGHTSRRAGSRFVAELSGPEIQARTPQDRFDFTDSPAGGGEGNDYGLKLGDTVRHRKFGVGEVVRLEGSGEGLRVHVNFRNAGTRILMASLARLELQ